VERQVDDTARVRRGATLVFGLLALSLLATGWTALRRGLFQDDALVLQLVFRAPGDLWQRLTVPISSPTRRLQGIPYALALASGHPLLVLRLTGELLSFGIGLLAAALARHALRLGAAGSFVAGALTLTASSDWLTASTVALGYNFAIVLHLAGACALVRWSRGGNWIWLLAAVGLGNASLWTIDAAAPLHPFIPLLAWLAADDDAMRRRCLIGGAIWLLGALPYYCAFLAFLADPRSYAQVAFVDTPWSARLLRGTELFGLNFSPWRWAIGRPQWFAVPPSVLPLGTRVALTGVGVALCAGVLAALQRRGDATAGVRRLLPRVLTVLLFTLLANAPYAAVQISEFRYRTQLMSRVWASLALALIYAGLSQRREAWSRRLAMALVLAFVGLGLFGALERQDYFTSYAQRLRSELGSIVEALPAAGGDAHVLLRLPPHPLYTATEANYLARAWLALLAADAALECRSFLLAPERGARCEATPTGLTCRDREATDCVAPNQATILPYDRLVVLDYDPATNRYRLAQQLPEDLTPAGDAAAAARRAYDPLARRRAVSPSWLARDLLELAPPATN
jgi:hypothetical protein